MTRRFIITRSALPDSRAESPPPRAVASSPAPRPVAPAPVAVAAPAQPDLYRVSLLLAAEANVDPRSARRALERGGDAVSGRAGERIRAAAERLGVVLGVADEQG